MIISHIIGGLGNQLFQYAVGRRLSLTLKVPYKIDTSAYKTYPLSHYELDHFAIQAEVANDREAATADVMRLLPGQTAKDILSRLTGMPHYRREEKMTFDPAILALSDNNYLTGYWQSEKYFADCIPQIRQDLTFVDPIVGQDQALLAEIAATNAVMIHVRRGDYVTNQTFNNILGTCSLEYYRQSVEYIAQRVKNPHFYVFSNDAAWTKANLIIDYPTTYITHNPSDQPQADLRLMAACKHFIIANSTFSWWGAWLSTHPEKIIIAPKRWFNDPSYDATDLVPESWIRL